MSRYVRTLVTLVLCLWTAVVMAQQQGRGSNGRGQGGGGLDESGQRGQFGPGGPGGRMGMGGPGGPGGMSNPMFEAIDTDGDGVITKAELRKAAAALKTLDADGDGTITLAEASPAGGPGGPGGDPSQMVDRMMENDRNGDGKLTEDEVPEFMSRMIAGADKNNDGAVDREELTEHMEEMQSRGPGGPGGRGDRGNRGMGIGRNMDTQQMAQQMMQNDQNGDGKLTVDEVPQQMMPMLQGADTNNDKAIDADELKAAIERMQERMNNRRSRFGGPGGGQFGPGGGQQGGRGTQ